MHLPVSFLWYHFLPLQTKPCIPRSTNYHQLEIICSLILFIKSKQILSILSKLSVNKNPCRLYLVVWNAQTMQICTEREYYWHLPLFFLPFSLRASQFKLENQRGLLLHEYNYPIYFRTPSVTYSHIFTTRRCVSVCLSVGERGGDVDGTHMEWQCVGEKGENTQALTLFSLLD